MVNFNDIFSFLNTIGTALFVMYKSPFGKPSAAARMAASATTRHRNPSSGIPTVSRATAGNGGRGQIHSFGSSDGPPGPGEGVRVSVRQHQV